MIKALTRPSRSIRPPPKGEKHGNSAIQTHGRSSMTMTRSIADAVAIKDGDILFLKVCAKKRADASLSCAGTMG
jgi:hypothetical protein